MLNRHHFNVGDNLDCLLCGLHVEETVEHLFFHYTFSSTCWQYLGIGWNDHNHRLQLLEQARTTWERPMFMDIFLVASWSLWKERNNNYFRSIAPTFDSWRQRFAKDFADTAHRTSDSKKQFITDFLATLPHHNPT